MLRDDIKSGTRILRAEAGSNKRLEAIPCLMSLTSARIVRRPRANGQEEISVVDGRTRFVMGFGCFNYIFLLHWLESSLGYSSVGCDTLDSVTGRPSGPRSKIPEIPDTVYSVFTSDEVVETPNQLPLSIAQAAPLVCSLECVSGVGYWRASLVPRERQVWAERLRRHGYSYRFTSTTVYFSNKFSCSLGLPPTFRDLGLEPLRFHYVPIDFAGTTRFKIQFGERDMEYARRAAAVFEELGYESPALNSLARGFAALGNEAESVLRYFCSFPGVPAKSKIVMLFHCIRFRTVV